MKLTIPELSFVILIGPSGCGKSTFARAHFRPTEVISSDHCRALVSDDENDQAATKDAFEVLHFIAAKRLAAGRLTVVDATNVQPEARKPLIALARQYHALPVAIALNLPEETCRERNRLRADRAFGPHVIRNQAQSLRRSLRGLEREGFRHVHILTSPEQVDSVTIERQPLWNNRRTEHGPFDIIGDIHGCYDELVALLRNLGYAVTEGDDGPCAAHPDGRKAVLLGDLVDRGPKIASVLRLAMAMSAAGSALCVPGNHDMKLVRALRGRKVTVNHGLEESLAQLESEGEGFRTAAADFLDGLVSHYVLDDGKLVVAHAGMREEMQGRGSGKVRDFALYGETTGETDEFGLPVRADWAAEYRGPAMVVYGHTPTPQPEWLNNTINIDTGCVFGGALTALRYPERELISAPSAREYAEPARPFLKPAEDRSAQQELDDVLDLADVVGKRIVETRLMGKVTIREENAAAALEAMSRFAADPHWLIYLPPTMSPSETTARPGLLEHPDEAFAYFTREGAGGVVCEEKHMGSRAVVIVCRDEGAARARFGVTDGSIGACLTRTGRRFFQDAALESALLNRVRDAVGAAGWWEEFATEWVCIDAELMPWSAKAMSLVRGQYAAVGAASRAAFRPAIAALEAAAGRMSEDGEIEHLFARTRDRAEMAERFTEAYRRYCRSVDGLEGYRLAPFHLLATEGSVHADKPNVWHMDTLSHICSEEGLLMPTPYRTVDLASPESREAGIAWWERLTEAGGEGMVVKPLDFVLRGRRGLAQPALKCRGRDYLRMVYGAEYTAPENLERLRNRGVSTKRSLAANEFALGIEALERFVRREPLRRVHECVFGVLAMESKPVDPRL
ncbi:MAG TPA: polynucleotide kinase-phosphatase [Armatimonadota bacterium]|jgi:polynucleotide kinase-phosphatase